MYLIIQSISPKYFHWISISRLPFTPFPPLHLISCGWLCANWSCTNFPSYSDDQGAYGAAVPRSLHHCSLSPSFIPWLPHYSPFIHNYHSPTANSSQLTELLLSLSWTMAAYLCGSQGGSCSCLGESYARRLVEHRRMTSPVQAHSSYLPPLSLAGCPKFPICISICIRSAYTRASPAQQQNFPRTLPFSSFVFFLCFRRVFPSYFSFTGLFSL